MFQYKILAKFHSFYRIISEVCQDPVIKSEKWQGHSLISRHDGKFAVGFLKSEYWRQLNFLPDIYESLGTYDNFSIFATTFAAIMHMYVFQ